MRGIGTRTGVHRRSQGQLSTSTRHEFDGGKASFNLPLGWTAKDVPVGTPDYPASGITVQDETGKTVANFQHGAAGGLGGACPNEKYRMTELDTAPTSLNAQWAMSAGVRFSYRVLDQTSVGKGLSYQVGLVEKSSGQVQDTCLMYTVVTGTPRGILSFADRAVQDAAEPRLAAWLRPARIWRRPSTGS